MNIETPIRSAAVFDPVAFFDGRVEASGMVTDFRGRITRRFVARFDGEQVAPDAIEIREQLRYLDGGMDIRNWRIARTGEGVWRADADGLVGSARITRDDDHPGDSRWAYTMAIPVNGKSIRFAMEDIMSMVSADEMVAQTPMRKFGLTLATITSCYRRP